MVAGTFNGFTVTGAKSSPNAAAASISMLFILGAVVFGLFTKYFKPNQKVEFVAGIVLLLVMLAVGIAFPLYFTKKILGSQSLWFTYSLHLLCQCG